MNEQVGRQPGDPLFDGAEEFAAAAKPERWPEPGAQDQEYFDKRAAEQYPTIARLADLSQTTVGYQKPELEREAVECYRALTALQARIDAMAKERDDLDMLFERYVDAA